MIITVASFKGGVGKTTTAVHLAAYLQDKAPALLIDGDPNRSASGWARRGRLPFKVVDERQAARYVPNYDHIVIDTEARPNREDLEALIDGCDLLVLPSTPDALALDALLMTVETLQGLGADRYRILLTMIPPRPSNDGAEAHAALRGAPLPVFSPMVRRLVAFQKAALAGVPVYAAADPRAKLGWDDYLQVGKEILGMSSKFQQLLADAKGRQPSEPLAEPLRSDGASDHTSDGASDGISEGESATTQRSAAPEAISGALSEASIHSQALAEVPARERQLADATSGEAPQPPAPAARSTHASTHQPSLPATDHPLTRLAPSASPAPEAPRATAQAAQEAAPEAAINRRGRPPGKRSNPDYEQVTAYISKKTHRAAKIALLQQEDRREFSELIEELVLDWLQAQAAEPAKKP